MTLLKPLQVKYLSYNVHKNDCIKCYLYPWLLVLYLIEEAYGYTSQHKHLYMANTITFLFNCPVYIYLFIYLQNLLFVIFFIVSCFSNEYFLLFFFAQSVNIAVIIFISLTLFFFYLYFFIIRKFKVTNHVKALNAFTLLCVYWSEIIRKALTHRMWDNNDTAAYNCYLFLTNITLDT